VSLLKYLLASYLLTVLLGCAVPSAAAGGDPSMLQPGTPAPNFTADSATSGTFRLSDYRGRIVVLDFWATWCGPCMRAMPHLQNIASRFGNSNVVVLAVCSWDSPDAAVNWIRSHPSGVTYAIDPAGEHTDLAISNDYHVSGIPSTYIIDQGGTIVDGDVGMDESEIAADVERLGARGAGSPVVPEPPRSGGSYEVGHADRTTVVMSRRIELKGYMSAKAVDPYAKLTEELKRSGNTEIVRSAHGWVKNHSLYRR